MYYDLLFLLLFIGGCMHGLHWHRGFLVAVLITHLITHLITMQMYECKRVDIESIALAAHVILFVELHRG
jgi:hypothetical protein